MTTLQTLCNYGKTRMFSLVLDDILLFYTAKATATQEADGYICKQYNKPVLSENITINGEVAYLHGLYSLNRVFLS